MARISVHREMVDFGSGKGGRNVKQKAGLNRSLLDASIGLLYQMLAYKAEEAGGQLMDVIPNNTSQNCFWCGQRVAKDLAVRTHRCPHCGFTADRDYNAALIFCSWVSLRPDGNRPRRGAAYLRP